MGDDRTRINIPDDLAERLDRYFGESSTTWSGTIVAALWYAVERYEAEHDIERQHEPTHSDLDDEDQ